MNVRFWLSFALAMLFAATALHVGDPFVVGRIVVWLTAALAIFCLIALYWGSEFFDWCTSVEDALETDLRELS